ncbi:MAG: hypothetical protein JNM12_14970 [Alphaproteobacteria bacterium]|nr:hypothetical protein [Alphaproteobacteria bacterium]
MIKYENVKKFSKTVLFKTCFVLFLGAVSFSIWFKYSDMAQTARTAASFQRIKDIYRAVDLFQKQYHALPGDWANAGGSLKGCTGSQGMNCNPQSQNAGDGIVGARNFAKTFQMQKMGKTSVPAVSETDETILFWAHLHLAGLLMGVDTSGIENQSTIDFGKTNPRNPAGGGYVAGYSDGTPFPNTISPANAGVKGLVILLVSDDVLQGGEMNTEGKQAISPYEAAMIDRKVDDGNANTGKVQAYGSPRCFYAAERETPADKEHREELKRSGEMTASSRIHATRENSYNEILEDEKECGLIVKIAD